MKIVVISSWYPSPEDRTTGSFVHEQVRMLQKNGHVVTVIKPNLNGTIKDTYRGRILKDRMYHMEGVNVYEVNVNVYIPKLKAFYYRTLEKKVVRVLKQHRLEFDLIHSHSLLTAGIVAPYLAHVYSRPLVHTEHTSGLIYAPGQFDQADISGIEQLLQTANKVLFVSRFAKEHSLTYKDSISDKLSIVHNVVEASFFEKGFSEKKQTVLVIGDFIERKNHAFILESWKLYQQQHPDHGYRLIFRGNGFDSVAFKELSAGIDNLETGRRLDRKGVVEAIAEAAVLLSASRLETFGLTIAEALALGVPVVVSDSGGVRDIVEPGDGFIVEGDSVELFTSKITAVLNGQYDPPETIRERCHRKFSEPVIYGKLADIYTDCLN